MSLNYNQCQENINEVFKYLDTIDLKPYIQKFKNKTAWDLMNKLENDFPYTNQYSKTLFDAISEDEFVDYLNEKYNLNIKETTVSYYYI